MYTDNPHKSVLLISFYCYFSRQLNMNTVIGVVVLLLLCMVLIVSSQGYIRLARVNPMMLPFIPSTNEKNEIEKHKMGHMEMVNRKMHFDKRDINSDEMFRHFMDYIFQIKNA